MSRTFSLLMILGLLVLILTPSLARNLEDDESWNSDASEDHDEAVEDEELLWGIDNLIKHRHRHHAPPPHHRRHHHAPPPHHRRHHLAPPPQGF